ncbi:hypothetical protein [Pseudorhodoferax sp. Leaf267]|uniref:hypothetical protein n=1 Tax=Pseudorhodoferax sp. Leaf267 TaxID=1736316 RepID=UPI0006F946EF|nr:hypothetical protein [Pseudorhodoferax sp. Leaf267]KQP14253.1 hypothetical protein ASF43_15635 [Pseudorhodoferax sp. Leaf267]
MAPPPTDEWQVVHVQPRAPAKPAVGAPCNGCGLCCLAEPCPLGVLLSRRRHGACSALRWDDGQQRYLCGALDRPWLAPLARRWIAAGIGCDADITPLRSLPP